jgi:hypothetical protein
MNPKVVKHYLAKLTLTHPKPRICEVTGIDLETLKDDCNRILGGNNVTFKPLHSGGPGTPGVTLVYHPSFEGGKTWVGEITSFEITEDMSIGNQIAQRLQTAA